MESGQAILVPLLQIFQMSTDIGSIQKYLL